MIYQGQSSSVNTGHVVNQSHHTAVQGHGRTLYEGQGRNSVCIPNNRPFQGQRQGQFSDNYYTKDNIQTQNTDHYQGYGKTDRQEQSYRQGHSNNKPDRRRHNYYQGQYRGKYAYNGHYQDKGYSKGQTQYQDYSRGQGQSHQYSRDNYMNSHHKYGQNYSTSLNGSMYVRNRSAQMPSAVSEYNPYIENWVPVDLPFYV